MHTGEHNAHGGRCTMGGMAFTRYIFTSNTDKISATVQIKCNITSVLQLLCYFKNANFEEVDFQNKQDGLTDYCTVASRPQCQVLYKAFGKGPNAMLFDEGFHSGFSVNIQLSKKKHSITSTHCFNCC